MQQATSVVCPTGGTRAGCKPRGRVSWQPSPSARRAEQRWLHPQGGAAAREWQRAAMAGHTRGCAADVHRAGGGRAVLADGQGPALRGHDWEQRRSRRGRRARAADRSGHQRPAAPRQRAHPQHSTLLGTAPSCCSSGRDMCTPQVLYAHAHSCPTTQPQGANSAVHHTHYYSCPF
jgi:hypothetical protein